MDIQAKRPLQLEPTSALPIKVVEKNEQAEAKKAAHQFEVMLAQQLVHEMTSSVGEGSLLGKGVESRMFGSMIEWDLAEHISNSSSLGIANDLLKQISPKESGHDKKAIR